MREITYFEPTAIPTVENVLGERNSGLGVRSLNLY